MRSPSTAGSRRSPLITPLRAQGPVRDRPQRLPASYPRLPASPRAPRERCSRSRRSETVPDQRRNTVRGRRTSIALDGLSKLDPHFLVSSCRSRDRQLVDDNQPPRKLVTGQPSTVIEALPRPDTAVTGCSGALIRRQGHPPRPQRPPPAFWAPGGRHLRPTSARMPHAGSPCRAASRPTTARRWY